MTHGRWYPTATALPSGKILAMSGYKEEPENGHLVINDVPAIFDADSRTWIDFTRASALMPDDFTKVYNSTTHPGITYPAGHVIPFGDWKGEIIFSAPQNQAWRFNPDLNARNHWNSVASERTLYREGCCTVMLHIYPTDSSSSVVTLGGTDEGTTSVELLSINTDYADWIALESMAYPRSHANAILMPDGTLLVIGGNTNDQYLDSELTAESYDPETGNWTLLPAMQFQRNYHSTAVLMPDGRVWVGGGDFKLSPTDSVVRQMNNIEIFTPGYLQEPLISGSRPVIGNCDSVFSYNTEFSFTVNRVIEKALLIRPGSTTHAFDQNQRAIYVHINGYVETEEGDFVYSAVSPFDNNIAPPGIYMLFVVLAKSESLSGETAVPSVAKFVSIS
ncbi:MAG: DUF1929 domain-containing protein [Ignavibacteria bacterium]|nr:DUF1929 domain-containing protein [Ignavibacteria bacterium]